MPIIIYFINIDNIQYIFVFSVDLEEVSTGKEIEVIYFFISNFSKNFFKLK